MKWHLMAFEDIHLDINIYKPLFYSQYKKMSEILIQ